MNINTDEIIHFLSGINILKELNVDIIGKIAQHTQVERFAKDQMIIKHGKSGQRLYFVYEGKVEVQLPDVDGEIRKRITLKKGDIIGEISLLFQSTYSADIIAVSSTITFFLDKLHFSQLIDQIPEFANIMYGLITSRMAQNGGINRVGKYQLLDKLGEGNMATVFRAYDNELQREVALKMLNYKLAWEPKFLGRFEQEAIIIASLNHPNIVNVYEVIAEYSTRFIVMEKLEGQNLSKTLKQNGAFSIRETREILLQVVSALQYAHSEGAEGIVHRDIKPSNIVVDHRGNVKITDFGISGPPQSKDINIEGTPSYIAPEIINGEPIDGRADIYSLGVTAFQMLTNRLPFIASNRSELLKMQSDEQPPDIRFACFNIDEDLAVFIESSMSKDPDSRISDWAQMKRRLKPIPDKSTILLDPDELGVLIKFHDSSTRDLTRLIKAIQEMLHDEGVNHTVEMHQGATTGTVNLMAKRSE